MRNQKKWIAVMTAVCMMAPSAPVLAAAPSPTYPPDTTLEGGGVIEHDPEKIEEFIDIVLPTSSTTAYNFTLDPTHLLPEYSDEYDDAHSAYFKSQKNPEMLEYVGSTTDTNAAGAKSKLYIKEPQPVTITDAATQLGDVVKLNTAQNGVEITAGYYVWIPDTAKAPQGKFVEIDATNAAEYIDYTLDTSANPATLTVHGFKRHNVNTHATPSATNVAGVFDGGIYKDGYVELTAPYTVTDYVTVASGVVSALGSKKLYVCSDSSDLTDATKFSEVTAVADVKYVEAETEYKDTSDVATIINKSSNNTTVKVTATLTNVGNLNMTNDDTFGASATKDETASLYLAVQKGTGQNVVKSPIVSNGAETPVYKVEVTCPLTGANDINDYNTYQSGINADNGGHNYVRYTKQNITYGQESFSLIAKANENAEAKDAWKTYAAGVTAATRPKITVVYHVEKTKDTVQLTNKTWGSDGLWFGEGKFTDSTKLTSIVAVETDSTTTGEITIAKLTPEGYVNVTWDAIVDAGHDDAVTTGYKIRVVYDGTTYELDL